MHTPTLLVRPSRPQREPSLWGLKLSSQADCPEFVSLRVYILRCPYLGLRAELALTLLMAEDGTSEL